MAYTTAQTFGWNWGEDLEPQEDARFSLVYTGAILLASVVILAGVDPFQLTLSTMVINAAVLPFVAIPFLLLMNDGSILGKHKNGWISNAVTIVVVLLSLLFAVFALPLTVTGGG